MNSPLPIVFERLTRALRPFVEARLRPIHGDGWEAAAKQKSSVERGNRPLDAAALLNAVLVNGRVFASLDHPARAYASELLTIRHRWAHQEPIDAEDTARALDTACRLLRLLSANAEANEINRLRREPDAALAPNGFVQIARRGHDGVYVKEDLDFEHIRPENGCLVFKCYDRHAQIINVKIHVDVVLEAAFGDDITGGEELSSADEGVE